MAGITEANYKSNDEGSVVVGQTVPSMGSLDGTARVASNPDDGLRAEGVNYDTSISVGQKVTTEAYPAGTAMSDSTPSDPVN